MPTRLRVAPPGARACVVCLVLALVQQVVVGDVHQRHQATSGGSHVQDQINWESRRAKGVKELRLGSELRGEVVKYGEDTARYKLSGLKPSTSYEVKLSYPGISHAKVLLRWGGKREAQRRKGGRRLLDIEKLEFATGADGAVLLGASERGPGGGAAEPPVVLVSARQRAPHVHGKDARGAYLIYDVALSEVRMGLPVEAAALVPILGAVMVVVLVVACCVAPVGGLEGHPAARWQRARQMQQDANAVKAH